MLSSIKEIEFELDNKFSPFQGEMDDLILRERDAPLNNLSKLEQNLDVELKDTFLSFVMEYNLDNFSLGNISFGSGGDYFEKLIYLNEGNGFNNWWNGQSRPKSMIIIALSDPYTILLNTVTGKIYAITSEPGINDEKSVADNFELFIRVAGSLFLKKISSQDAIKLTGATNQDFWKNIQ